MIFSFLQRNRSLLTFWAVYLAVILLVLLQIDKQYYQAEKKEVIRFDSSWFINQNLEEKALDRLADKALERLHAMGTAENQQGRLQQELLDRMNRIMYGDSIIYRITLIQTPPLVKGELRTSASRADDVIVAEVIDEEKVRRFNTFSNSLILKSFSGMGVRTLMDAVTEEDLGHIQFHYTSPREDAEIAELTNKWRWICIFVAAILLLLGWAIARALIVPTQNLLAALDQSTPEHTPFVTNARSRLELL